MSLCTWLQAGHGLLNVNSYFSSLRHLLVCFGLHRVHLQTFQINFLVPVYESQGELTPFTLHSLSLCCRSLSSGPAALESSGGLAVCFPYQG